MQAGRSEVSRLSDGTGQEMARSPLLVGTPDRQKMAGSPSLAGKPEGDQSGVRRTRPQVRRSNGAGRWDKERNLCPT